MRCVKPLVLFAKEVGESGTIKVPCGRCIACRLNKQSEWSIRLFHESLVHDKSVFVTFTYNDDSIPENGSLCKRDLQLFMKKLRKRFKGRKLRYFIGGEYGDKFDRAHYHGILFGVSKEDEYFIQESWSNGFIYVGNVTVDSCNYVAKYVTKRLYGEASKVYEESGRIPEFSVMSRRNGLGYDYIKGKKDELVRDKFVLRKGNKMAMPRYYEKKFFDTDELKDGLYLCKKKLFKEKLDEDIDKVRKVGYNEYYKDVREGRSQAERNVVSKIELKESRL